MPGIKCQHVPASHKGFLRASAHGAERVNGSYWQNQRDEGGGLVTNFLETCEIYHLDGLKGLMIKSKGQFRSEMTSEAILRSKLPRGCLK